MVVLVFEEQEYSQARLDALTSGLADRLAGGRVRAGDRVALMSSTRPEFIIAVRAIWRLGASVVLLSPAWKRGDVEHALAVSQPAHAVGDHPVLAELMPMLHLDELVELTEPTPVAAPGERPAPAEASAPGEAAAPDPAADALFVFSSGTTGLPKAVRHTHGSFAAAVGHWRDVLGMTAADRIQVATPPSHILGILNIVTALETGAWMRLHRRFSLDALLRSIQDDRITIEMAVAPIALAMASHPDLESFDLSSLRFIMWGATPVTASVAETVTRRAGVRWLPAYGASELPVLACNPLEGARLDSVGKAAPGVDLRVVDLETGKPLGPGETGEIQARSPSLMAGYLPEDANAEAFDDGWYRTGDVGTIDDDGWVRLTDRRKEMIKVRGFQVAPAEVEAVLHGHPAVADCAVFGVPDAASGEVIVAAVTRTAPASAPVTAPPGQAADVWAVTSDDALAAELLTLVGTRLASYKWPRQVVFVAEIPRLPSGKVLRRVLRDTALAPESLRGAG
ncbi:class I adenylate-forming enzyme family protein [Pseudofrankia sp. BMG5.37]|uniref:class I adenylate-forming enzyme family protein n=1 Tax=Pseudofrankia sp. BMG5.37 TaxID=3050035 RepID=UPI002894CEFD|nr:class I adenylate-forming enzyme family protein [Pseudofrankia sp. BMG5.37]MDT3443335.1 class I adenylate-forming enzyme family protein [Pseudofrankia sp. BMG5.37]